MTDYPVSGRAQSPQHGPNRLSSVFYQTTFNTQLPIRMGIKTNKDWARYASTPLG